ncbi:iron ABC transporter permease [Streptomyces cavernicola]|uniref:Iron ABC transporter permease n=1 Tax=Streptomyces cavernicola TaxID=3043613 RepID=A0ABT6S8A8_9ACTN|nr:iron ABC transporter permease [Streptomyces sp. B-S-A6]MDI3404341.1 iron ABC transporter permease [Streptomyces sp. B-S-A6]
MTSTAPEKPVDVAAPVRTARALSGPVAVVLGGVLALLLVAALHLGHGRSDTGLFDLVRLLFGAGDADTRSVLLGGRLPRTLAGLAAGAAFALSGALLQSSVRNPLAAPDTLGVTAGAYLAVAVAAITGLSLGDLPRGAVAFVGGLLAAALVHTVAGGSRGRPAHLVLAGVSVTLALSSVTAVLVMLFQEETGAIFFWGHGSLAVSDSDRSLAVLPLLGAGLLAGLLLARSLDILGTGDETARALGVHVGRTRMLTVLLSVFMAAIAVSVTGPIGFIGLAAPHLVRFAGVRKHAVLLPAAMLWGATLLLAADLLARVTSPTGNEVPAGVVTALFGAPVFLWLARRLPAEPAAPGTVLTPTRRPLPFPAVLAAGGVLLCAVLYAGLVLGDISVPWSQIPGILTGGGDALLGPVVLEYRLPRLLVAALAGALLAVAGGIVQTVSRNPLADLTVMGVSGGAGFGAALILVALPAVPYALLPVAALIGGTAAFALTYGLSRRKGSVAPERLVLVGIGCFALTTAATNYLVSGARFQVAQALTWLSGSTYARDTTDLSLLAVVAAAGIPLLFLSFRRMDLLALGEDTPRTLGVPLERTRLAVLTLAVALAACAVAVVGTVAFVGLVAPHAARMLTGSRTHRLLPTAAVLGATLMVTADVVGRVATAPAEIPSGLLAALIGTPYFVWQLRRGRRTA